MRVEPGVTVAPGVPEAIGGVAVGGVADGGVEDGIAADGAGVVATTARLTAPVGAL